MNKLDVLSCPGFYAETKDVAIQAVHCSLIFDIDYDLFTNVDLLSYNEDGSVIGLITYEVHDGIMEVGGMSFRKLTGQWKGILVLAGADGYPDQKIRLIVDVKNGIIQSLNVWQL